MLSTDDATTDIATTTNTPGSNMTVTGSNMTVTGNENIKLASILGVVLGVAFVLFLVVIALCVFLGWRRHQNRRYVLSAGRYKLGMDHQVTFTIPFLSQV